MSDDLALFIRGQAHGLFDLGLVDGRTGRPERSHRHIAGHLGFTVEHGQITDVLHTIYTLGHTAGLALAFITENQKDQT